MPEAKSIRDKVLKGGVFLTLRQLLSSGLSVISVLVIARSLGPEKYGLIAASLGIFYFLAWSGQMGLNMYLVRQPELERREVEQLMAFYNTVGVTLCLSMWFITPIFSLWTGVPEISNIIRWLIPAVWLNMVGDVSISMLSRDLKFDQISLVDGVSQIANYLLAVPVVLFSGSYWGPIAGIFLQFLIKAVIAYALHPVRLTLIWQRSCMINIMSYGVPFFFASWLQTLRSLTIPLVITPLAGVEAAGIVGVTLRMVEQLSLLRIVIRRMSISVMAKFVGNADSVHRMINRGMSYMALLMISVCTIFACMSSWLIPFLFGEEWIQSTKIFPLIAFAASVSALFDLHQATLHAIGRNNIVALQHFAYTCLLWLSCWLLIPSLGLWGYATAEILALPSYYVSHRAFTSIYKSPNYLNAVLIISFAIPSMIASMYTSITVSFTIFFLSYILLLILSPNVRETLIDLLLVIKKREGRELDVP